jgi:hypothetical protein
VLGGRERSSPWSLAPGPARAPRRPRRAVARRTVPQRRAAPPPGVLRGPQVHRQRPCPPRRRRRGGRSAPRRLPLPGAVERPRRTPRSRGRLSPLAGRLERRLEHREVRRRLGRGAAVDDALADRPPRHLRRRRRRRAGPRRRRPRGPVAPRARPPRPRRRKGARGSSTTRRRPSHRGAGPLRRGMDSKKFAVANVRFGPRAPRTRRTPAPAPDHDPEFRARQGARRAPPRSTVAPRRSPRRKTTPSSIEEALRGDLVCTKQMHALRRGEARPPPDLHPRGQIDTILSLSLGNDRSNSPYLSHEFMKLLGRERRHARAPYYVVN